jgi:hypothetical protein
MCGSGGRQIECCESGALVLSAGNDCEKVCFHWWGEKERGDGISMQDRCGKWKREAFQGKSDTSVT